MNSDMKMFKINFMPVVLAILAISLFSCKAKKAVVTTPPAPVEVKEEKPAPAPAPVQREEPAPVKEVPSFNYSNIQFEFNSSILKTPSYPILDQIASDMKNNPEVRLNLNGHSSLEGTEKYNMSLSQNRAAAVKTYLVNSGVNADNLVTVGYGETQPIASNATEEGRSLNRRVEIKK
jgi:OOP family OmpA-OmpF porin